MREEIIRDAEDLNIANRKLREKIAQNHSCTEDQEGILLCSLNMYYKCLPTVETTDLKALMDSEVTQAIVNL